MFKVKKTKHKLYICKEHDIHCGSKCYKFKLKKKKILQNDSLVWQKVVFQTHCLIFILPI